MLNSILTLIVSLIIYSIYFAHTSTVINNICIVKYLLSLFTPNVNYKTINIVKYIFTFQVFVLMHNVLLYYFYGLNYK